MNWTAVSSGLPADDSGNHGISSLVIDPKNPGTLYAGNALAIGGVFKTTDGGDSWIPANSGLLYSPVMALAIDPQTTGTLYASSRTEGVFRSTDGGTTWTATGPGLDYSITHGYDYVALFAIDPRDPNIIYVAGHADVDVEDGDNGLFKTSDGGTSWSALNLFTTVTAIVTDPRNSGTVYVGSHAGVSKTTDGGMAWVLVKSRQIGDIYGDVVVSALAIDSQNPDTVYAASDAGLLQTTDAGASWATVNSDLRRTSPRSVFALKMTPQNPGTIYAGTDIGVFKSTDTGGTWTPVNSGLPNGYYGRLIGDRSATSGHDLRVG
jgi:photosystem II stability/assembly factor-like uncharacterized protein